MRVGRLLIVGLPKVSSAPWLSKLLAALDADREIEIEEAVEVDAARLDPAPSLALVSLADAAELLQRFRDVAARVPTLVLVPRRSVARALRLERVTPLELLPSSPSQFDLRRAVASLEHLVHLERRATELKGRLQVSEEDQRTAEERIHELTDQLRLLRREDTSPLTLQQEYSLRRIEESIEMARRYEVPLACLLVGIAIENGEEIPDAALARVAGRLKRCVRNTDLITLYGKDEFLVLSPFTNRKAALALGRRLLAEVQHDDLPGFQVSIGVAAFAAGMRQPHDLMDRAAEALALARRSETRIEAL